MEPFFSLVGATIELAFFFMLALLTKTTLYDVLAWSVSDSHWSSHTRKW
jgi:hypothetical protein